MYMDMELLRLRDEMAELQLPRKRKTAQIIEEEVVLRFCFGLPIIIVVVVRRQCLQHADAASGSDR
jgi:hypothetical protein